MAYVEDGYRIEEPREYEAALEYRRELEPKAAIAEREETRRRFERYVRAIEAAEQRLERRRAVVARRGQGCDVEGCSGDLASPESCCDACLFAYWLEAQRDAASPMVNPWTTADGRYFANESDAATQQRWLREKRQRQADRIAAYMQRRGLTATTEAEFLAAEFEITDAGRAALAEARAEDAAADANARNVARMFDAIANSVFPGLSKGRTA